MHQIKYRSWFKGIPPKKIKLQVPGWAGENHHHSGQAWHCKPFIDGSVYGLELIYPFKTEVVVKTVNGELIFEDDFTEERNEAKHNWVRPFSHFAPHHFGFTSSLDIKTEPGFGIMILPHPRVYTDRTGTVPMPVAGFIESDWWARIFFVVFKSPLEGQKYVFRYGEPYAQILVLPKEVKYDIKKMTPEEENQRALQEKLITDNVKTIATNIWQTDAGETFDNKYKVLSKMAKEGEITPEMLLPPKKKPKRITEKLLIINTRY